MKWHEVTQTFVMVDCVREITAKKSCMADKGRVSICSSCCTEIVQLWQIFLTYAMALSSVFSPVFCFVYFGSGIYV